MYEELFQTPDRPFRATPDARFYFAFDSMEQIRQTVLRVTRRAEGPAAVMGGVGLGKSLLAQVLADDLSDRFDVVRLHAARLCSRRAMLQSILFELQLPYRDLSEGELRLSLMERMEPAPQHAPEGLVLIVDEAQTLPTKLLEELRLITNFARQGQARARMVLLGGMQLEETFALPEMSSFNQRLAARCFLQPMNRQETAEFVRHQFACVQIDPKQIITRDALENVYVASEGIPRLVNQVMDHALILAIANDQYPISAALIQEAWSDLQQLPLGWDNEEPTTSTPVEFGSIDDLDQDFELEPEGADDLNANTRGAMHWPALNDLEDFGPTGSSAAFPHSSAQHVKSAAPPSSTTDKQSATGARVVFDASPLFAEKTKPAPSPEQPSVSQAMNASYAAANAEMRTLHDNASTDYDLFIFPEDQVATEPEPAVIRNRFATWQQPADAFDHRGPSGQPSARSFEFTADQSADAAMNTVPAPLAHIHEQNVSDPFGQDFDEEFAVDASDVMRWQERQRAFRKSQASQSPMSGKTQAMAETKTTPHSNVNSAPVSTLFVDAADLSRTNSSRGQAQNLVEQIVVQPPMECSFACDCAVVAETSSPVDVQLQTEIEDMISQLNFSAFSVETESVEQISPEFTRRAVSASGLHDAHGHTPRGVQYASHPIRPDEHSDSIKMSTFDDDRDLLIIEEDVPSSVRHHSMPVLAPTGAAMSYPELFQQLRG